MPGKRTGFVVAALAPYRLARREPSPGKSAMPKAHVNGINIEHDGFDDMADDAVGLLEALGIERAHIVGRSMGGMIAQIVASEHPERTLTLTSIMSSSGNPGLPPSSPEAMAVLTQRAPHPSQDEKGFLDHSVRAARILGSPGFPFDETLQRAQALGEAKRAYDPAGFGRQIVAAGDRRARLNTIAAPTLVLHGAADPLIPLAGGHDTAANIKGAELRVIEGMGHEIPPGLYQTVAQAIADNARRTHSPLAGRAQRVVAPG